MSRSVEDILLQIRHVKHKKNEGTLYLMGERLAWMASHKNDTFAVNHKYVDIKSQKISPEGKPKIQLQVVLHDGTCTTFHFNDPVGGRDAQIKQRDEVKDLLTQLLPTFKKKMNKELEEKNRMLSENPGLLQLYKDLVITNIITPEEFWSQHVIKNRDDASSSSSKNSKVGNQEVGVAGSFLSEIKPQADGANGIRYNLTVDIIQSIFKTYPAVKRKHSENVPSKMSEQDFWTKFFQSHYFHRDRLHGKGVKDIFTECAKDDDKRMKEQTRAGVADPLANIQSLSDKTIDDSFGASDTHSASNIVHQSIIKRFNQHSIMVMNAGQDKIPSASAVEKPVEKVDKTKEPILSAEEQVKQADNKRKRLLETTEYEDLDEGPARKAPTLNITKSERYFIGPTPSSSHSNEAQFSMQEIQGWRQNLMQSVQMLRRDNCRHVLSARSAVSVLNDLSPGGALMKSSTQETLAEQYPAVIHQDLKSLYASLSELLRHFWACFSPMPPTTSQLIEKANKMHETLRKFENVKLRPFENELARQYSSGPNITMHIHQMLEAAYRKFQTWKKNAGRHAVG